MPFEYMRDVYQKLRHHDWVPAEPVGVCPRRSRRRVGECSDHRGDSGPPSVHARNVNIMRVLVREALGLVASGGNEHDYERAIARLALNGVDVGDKYHLGRHI